MGEWQHGLFGCFDNCGLCIKAYFIPCVLAGQNAEKVGENCFYYGCLFTTGYGLYTQAIIRGKIRDIKGIEGSFCNDLLMYCFCAQCALVQEAQEFEGGEQAQVAESMARY